MKSEEDEAFDDLAKRQGDWGGGFPAKRAMAADKLQEPDWKTMPPKDAPLVQWAKEQTAPPQRPWVGLTDDEVNNLAAGCHLGKSVQGAIYEAAAKLKEKNT